MSSELNPAREVQAQAYDIVVDPLELTVSEPSGTDTFTISLSDAPTNSVYIPLSRSNTECSISTSLVQITTSNWSEGVEVTVTAVDDLVDDGTQICTVRTGTAVSEDSHYDGTNPADVTVYVEDDSDAASIDVDPLSLEISEPDGAAPFTIRLGSQPEATVVIGLSTSNNQCTLSTAQVILDAGNWSAGVAVTVGAVDDDIADGPQTCVVQTAPSTSSDPVYDNVDPPDVTVTVGDDDHIFLVYLPSVMGNWPPIPSAPVLETIDNADGDGAYTIRWQSVSGADLYILEQAKQSTFADATTIYIGTSRSHVVTGRGAARYYYRVRARNAWGTGNWSTPQWVDVLWEAEPNGQALTQANGPLVSGLTYYGVLSNAADVQDYFYVDLPAAHPVELWLTNIPGGEDYSLVLRNAALQTVEYSAQPGNTDEHIQTGALPAGRYFVQVYNASSGGSTQPYHLRVVYQ